MGTTTVNTTATMKTVIIEPSDLDNVIGMKSIWMEMLALRAYVFRDILQWDVRVTGGMEVDQFDTSPTGSPIYVIVVGGRKVIGSLRLLPTTGPTMMSEVFHDTIVGEPISDPSVWECSRTCWLPSTKLRQLQVSLKLIEGIRQVAAKHGIKTLVGNFDDRMYALYSRAGFALEMLGETTVFGPLVHLGKFDISPAIMDRVEATLNRYIEQLQDYQGAA